MSSSVNRDQQGVAGRRGEDVRSDLWVAIEALDAGQFEVELTSRVETYFGDAIRKQVEEVLTELGSRGARVTLEDAGALPFVIGARLETAVRRAGWAPRTRWLPETTLTQPPSTAPDRLRRSRLYLPGNEPKFFINAGLHQPDAIILDLEDSVSPDEKDAARLVVRNALRAVDFAGAERMVRINQLPLGLEDLEEIVPQAPDLILIPKVESPDQVREVDEAISSLQAEARMDRDLWLMPILESALGIENAFEIGRASPRTVALTLGLEDYAADLGVPKSAEGEESLYARTRVVNAARALGLQAIDSVFGNVSDMEGLGRWGQKSRALGFQGMGCLHPRQITVIHEAYQPSRAEIDKALRIVAAFDEAEAKGLSVVSLGSKMIDPPVVKQALRLVEQAKRLGLTIEGEQTEAES
ncbi:MAG: citrate lyase ACP [Nitrospirae bacterium]|nr:citrate lyase ACP [Nitrospirota bacterium]